MTAMSKAPGTAKVMTSKPLQPNKSYLFLSLLGAAVLRLGLSLYTDAFHVLQDRPELSSPFSSFKSLMETHYLFRHPPTPPPTSSLPHIPDPYSAGTIHHSPLLLPFLDSALDRVHSAGNELPIVLIWTAADVIAGWLLFHICLAREKAAWATKTHLWAWDASRGVKVVAMFLFNPYTVASCVARSSTSLEVFAILVAIHAAMSGELVYEREIARIRKNATSTDTKAARQHGFLVDRVRSAKRRAVFKCLFLMPTSLIGGLWLSRAIALSPGNAFIGAILLNLPNVLEVPLESGWAWAEQVYGSLIFASDLTPNLGLWWYFFMEIFDHFRDFFLLTFNVHLACYVLPFCIKYRQDPLFGITLMSGVIAVFKSYPTMGDHALFLGLLSLHSQIFEYLRYPLVTTLTYAYCTCLSPAFHHLWLTAGSANANFFYAITLVWALGGGMLVLDAMWAWGRERWEKERPAIRARVQQQEKQINVGVSIETATGHTEPTPIIEAVTLEKSLEQAETPRRRVVVQV